MKIYDLFHQELTNSKILMEFHTMNFYPYKRGFIWYLVFHIILIATVYFVITNGTWPLASFVLVLAGFYMVQNVNSPESFDFKIKEDALQFANKQVAFSELRGFFIDKLSDSYKVLHLIPKEKKFHESTIQLFNIPEQKIISHLKLKVPYLKDASPSLMDRITFLLKI